MQGERKRCVCGHWNSIRWVKWVIHLPVSCISEVGTKILAESGKGVGDFKKSYIEVILECDRVN